MNENLQPISSINARTYALQGEVRKKWWRFWFTEQSASCLIFLGCIPFFMAAMYATITGGHPTPKLIHLATMMLWLPVPAVIVVGACWLSIARDHFRRSLSLIADDHGLTLEVPFKRTTLLWHQINDVFLASTNEFAIWTKQGSFYFPKEMDHSDELYATIKTRLETMPQQYDLALLVRDGFWQSCLMAPGAILIALFTPLLRTWLTDSVISSGSTILIVGLSALSFACLYILLFKMPTAIRAGANGILMRDRSGDHFISWNKVTGLHNLGDNLTIITADSQRYVLIWPAYLMPEKIPRFLRHKNLSKLQSEWKSRKLELSKELARIAINGHPLLKG